MTEIHACLCGNWVNLSDDENCIVGEYRQDPITWWKEGAPIWSSGKRTSNSYEDLDYVNIHYRGKDYRINPIFIQVVVS
ncbi:ORF065 [Streptococcus dysgalactiae subsp. dysgalactiae]|uniref:ORF065 n=1 Tax=Streptococcus dysgalactiae subsp. dysgalactiae TaxID=99822 RepID=A0A380JTY5_STRDY|nr:hypothetical protein [Streptococcus dysgalactiae]EFY03468.1 hypothetical protein SDD27957_09345 [Streptococcus dysgalactiae subsp. dysgalactiae ATCC 27957]QBX14104.1 hypothetical protein Javan119_0066 [Streptococcus phage Javan119]SUN48809.1 ORF065 [Streptococcus dysgalactiae subsp. dysgalactiae]